MLEQFISVFLQKFLEIVLPVLATALAGLAIAWITKVISDLKSKLTDEQKWLIDNIIQTAVFAAEQVNLKGLVVDKKEYALSIAEKWMAEKGLNIDAHVLDAMIEAAVYEELNRDKTTTTTTSSPASVKTVTTSVPASEPE